MCGAKTQLYCVMTDNKAGNGYFLIPLHRRRFRGARPTPKANFPMHLHHTGA